MLGPRDAFSIAAGARFVLGFATKTHLRGEDLGSDVGMTENTESSQRLLEEGKQTG